MRCPQKTVRFCPTEASFPLTLQIEILLRNYYMSFQKVHLETGGWEETCSNCINRVCQTSEHHFRVRRLSIDLKGLFERDLLLYFRLPLSSNPGLPSMLESGFCKWLFSKTFAFCIFLIHPQTSNRIPSVSFVMV